MDFFFKNIIKRLYMGNSYVLPTPKKNGDAPDHANFLDQLTSHLYHFTGARKAHTFAAQDPAFSPTDMDRYFSDGDDVWPDLISKKDEALLSLYIRHLDETQHYLPARHLFQTLEYAQEDIDFWPIIFRHIGPLGKWLIEQNDEWHRLQLIVRHKDLRYLPAELQSAHIQWRFFIEKNWSANDTSAHWASMSDTVRRDLLKLPYTKPDVLSAFLLELLPKSELQHDVITHLLARQYPDAEQVIETVVNKGQKHIREEGSYPPMDVYPFLMTKKERSSDPFAVEWERWLSLASPEWLLEQDTKTLLPHDAHKRFGTIFLRACLARKKSNLIIDHLKSIRSNEYAFAIQSLGPDLIALLDAEQCDTLITRFLQPESEITLEPGAAIYDTMIHPSFAWNTKSISFLEDCMLELFADTSYATWELEDFIQLATAALYKIPDSACQKMEQLIRGHVHDWPHMVGQVATFRDILTYRNRIHACFAHEKEKNR